MKKILSLIAIILTFGVLALTQEVSAGRGPMAHGPGSAACGNCRQQATGDPQIQQQFLEATAGLRAALQAKRDAYFALMNNTAPDKEAAQRIWSEMFDLQAQLRAKGAEVGITPRGLCLGGPGQCNTIDNPRRNCPLDL